MRAILVGGLLAGVLDIIDALVVYGYLGVPSIAILQSIASGLLGRDAYRGGVNTAALGLLLHFVISCSIAAVYYLASRRLPLLVKQPVWCGLLFGVLAYFVMTYIVVPLSAFPGKSTFSTMLFLNGVIGHALLVGLPIALSTARFAPEKVSTTA